MANSDSQPSMNSNFDTCLESQSGEMSKPESVPGLHRFEDELAACSVAVFRTVHRWSWQFAPNAVVGLLCIKVRLIV